MKKLIEIVILTLLFILLSLLSGDTIINGIKILSYDNNIVTNMLGLIFIGSPLGFVMLSRYYTYKEINKIKNHESIDNR